MIRKIIYGVCVLAGLLFLIWLNIEAVKACLINTYGGSLILSVMLFVSEGLILIGAIISIIVWAWEYLWDYIDEKDEQIKTYFETKKIASENGSLSISENENKKGWLSK